MLVLVLCLVVRSVCQIGPPIGYWSSSDFSRNVWIKEPSRRHGMVMSLFLSYSFEGMSLDAVRDVIGEPDYVARGPINDELCRAVYYVNASREDHVEFLFHGARVIHCGTSVCAGDIGLRHKSEVEGVVRQCRTFNGLRSHYGCDRSRRSNPELQVDHFASR